MKNRIKVISTINANVGITVDDLKIRKVWKNKGAINYFKDYEELEQIFYDEGIEYLFTSGILYIEDMEVKKQLGLEAEDADKPKNVLLLTEDEMKKLLTVKPFYEFKEVVDTISGEVAAEFAKFAIENQFINDMEKIDYLTKRSSVQIFNIVMDEKRYAEKDKLEQNK